MKEQLEAAISGKLSVLNEKQLLTILNYVSKMEDGEPIETETVVVEQETKAKVRKRNRSPKNVHSPASRVGAMMRNHIHTPMTVERIFEEMKKIPGMARDNDTVDTILFELKRLANYAYYKVNGNEWIHKSKLGSRAA